MHAMDNDELLRVGVSGHRDLFAQDHQRIRVEVRSALMTLAGEFARASSTSDRARSCRLVSGLAAGADQLVAEEALALGWTLEALLPMAVEDYLTDFLDPFEQAGFERLMARCEWVTVIDSPLRLDGDIASERDQRYRDQGSRLVEAVEAMILLWDGRPAGEGACGTSWVVRFCQEEAHTPLDRIVVVPVRRASA